jgi:outer membrane protein assembly factor BamA
MLLGRHTVALLMLVGAALPSAAIAQNAPAARTFVLPYLGSAPETGIQYGATAFRVRQPSDTGTRPSTAQVFASYTAKRQARAFVEVDRWTAGNSWHLTGHLEWKRFPLPFYGFGDSTAERDEESYTPTGMLGSVTVQRRVHGPFYLLGGYAYQDIRITPSAGDGALANDAIAGNRGSRVGQLQLGALWDDRDDVFASRHGSFVQATGSNAARPLGSGYAFRRLVVDGRHFVPLGGSRVLAMQAVTELTGGNAPFDQVSLVGNSNYLRGYAHGRYRDADLAAVQAEYRAPLWRRLGWAAFAGAGRIASRPSRLFASDARTLPSYGVGLRHTLFASSRSNIRVDYARGGSGQSGLYVALNEAF